LNFSAFVAVVVLPVFGLVVLTTTATVIALPATP
jgi:hypothetical protein